MTHIMLRDHRNDFNTDMSGGHKSFCCVTVTLTEGTVTEDIAPV